jgi:putative flippase GtrA
VAASHRKIPPVENVTISLMARYTLQYIAAPHWQFAKYVFVGVVTFGVNFLTFHMCYAWVNLDYRISVSLAYVITLVSHFLLHRYFTFNAAEQQLFHNVGKYLALLGLNYVITISMAWFVVEILKLSPYFAVIATTAVTACSSFFVMKYFVFKNWSVSS